MTAKLTQKQELLQLLQIRGDRGVYVWEIKNSRHVGGLGISQYNARIFELREEGYNIISDDSNKLNTKFILVIPQVREKQLTEGAVQAALL